MAVISVNADTIQVQAKLKKAIRQLSTEISGALVSSAKKVLVPEIKANILSNRSTFKWKLYRSVNATSVVDSGTSVTIEVGALEVPYAEIVEKGSGPRNVSSQEADKIYEYVQTKMKVSGAMAGLITFVIIDTIKTRGNVPHPFIMPAYNKKKDEYVKTAQAEIRRILGLS